MNTFINQGCIKLIKTDSEDFYNVTNINFSKLYFFDLTIYQIILFKMYYGFHKDIVHC